jgi:group I intron endonuclease
MIQYIYKIENKLNGKTYIGKTKNFERRIKEHERNVGKKRHKLYDAILHYSWGNFITEIIDSTVGDIDQLEIFYINKFNTINEGYNYTEGGSGGDTFSNRNELSKKKTIKKISEKSKIINNKNKEIHRVNTKKLWEDDEYRKKVVDGVKLNHQTKEYKEKLSKVMKEKLKDPELRKKWSEVKKGKNNANWLGYVIVYDKDGVEIGKYETAFEAGKNLFITPHTIREKSRNGKSYNYGKYKDNPLTFKILKLNE